MSSMSSCFAYLWSPSSHEEETTGVSATASQPSASESNRAIANGSQSSGGIRTISLSYLRRDELRSLMQYLDFASFLGLARCSRQIWQQASLCAPYMWGRQSTAVTIQVTAIDSYLKKTIARGTPIHRENQQKPEKLASASNTVDSHVLLAPPSDGNIESTFGVAIPLTPVKHVTTNTDGLDLLHSAISSSSSSSSSSSLASTTASFSSCLLRFAAAIDLDATGERDSAVRDYLRRYVDKKCGGRCEYQVRGASETRDEQQFNSQIAPPSPSEFQVSEMVQLLDALLDSPLPRLNCLRLRGSKSPNTSDSILLDAWSPILRHSALQHLCQLELHPAMPVGPRRVQGQVQYPYLPLGVLSVLTSRVLQQMTSIKLVHPHVEDALMELTLMPQLHTLAIRGVHVAALDSVRRCTCGSLRQLRVFEGLNGYRYGPHTTDMFGTPRDLVNPQYDESVTHVESLYLGWTCPPDMREILLGDHRSLYYIFSYRLTHLEQLELEGEFFSVIVEWRFEGELSHMSLESINAYYDPLRLHESLEWTEGRHAGVLSNCPSLKRLIIHEERVTCRVKPFVAVLFALPQLSVRVNLQHPSCNKITNLNHGNSLSRTSVPALMQLAPRLTVVHHRAAQQSDYVNKHGDAF